MLAPARKRPAPPPQTQVVHAPAPIGGLNTVSVASDMPQTDCIYLYNMVAAELGLRSRLGYREWCTGLTDAAGSEVRTTLPFSGSHSNGSTDKLFKVTPKGIWDCTASSAAPSRVVTFATTTGDAGYGTSCVLSNAAGKFLLFCDEANGYYVYAETGATWTKVTAAATSNWASGHAYVLGDRVLNDSGKTYVCVTAGTSAGSGGPAGTGTAIADNTAAWDYVQAVVGGVNPANLVFPCVWKSRLFLVEKDSSRGWYGDVNAIFGTLSAFDFGVKMRAGGPLVGLYNWSYDGGSGMETPLVGLSSTGDVVIYVGTDPTSAATFGLKGTWSVGGVPYGRRIATDYGGDLLVLSTLGVLPLSKLVTGNPVIDRSQYETTKISNLFNRLASERRSLRGWALHIHPTDNALLILVPTSAGAATEQLAMSFATRGWSRYRDLPIFSAGVWNGQLYFGTADGRSCINDGYVDGVLLADSSAYTPVQYSLLTAFSNLGAPRNKRIQMVRPTVVSEGSAPNISCTARYNFDMSEPGPVAGAGLATAGTWDNALWDVDVWAGEYTPTQPLSGAYGMGRDVALAVRGTAISRTTYVGADVFYDVGGLL